MGNRKIKLSVVSTACGLKESEAGGSCIKVSLGHMRPCHAPPTHTPKNQLP